MNNETIKGTVSYDDLNIVRENLAHEAKEHLDAVDKLHIEIEFIDRLLNGHVITTHAEESAAKERAMKAHAEAVDGKGYRMPTYARPAPMYEDTQGPNKALDDAITQVEKKTGKPKRDTYGLIPGRTYKQSEIASKER